jgi:TolB-like protein/class 3 adenylate cyclase
MRLRSTALATERVERRLAAILAADVAGYSRLIGADEEGTLARLKAHRREVIDPKIGEHNGRIVKTTGDGLLVEFGSVIDALRCATEIQTGMAEHKTVSPSDRQIEFRIGIHQGDMVVEDGDIFGDGVNVAARLEGLAEPGGICVSARVQEDAAGRLDLAFEDMGEQALKNIARPVRAYRVVTAAGSPPTRVRSGPPLPDKPSIAVLPFANLSGDPDQEYFADGMVEEIITALSRIRWLFVIARNSSFTYKGQAVDVKQVGRELGVRYVLEGSVRKGGNRVRITAQLIDATNGAHIWADRFDGAFDDIFELQDEVASSVAGVIEPALQAAEIERARRKRPDSLDAYDLYLRALAELRRPTAEASIRALTLLRQAIAIDPGYAAAMAEAAFCFQRRQIYQWATDEEAEVTEGTNLARAAIATARDDARVLTTASFALWNLNADAEAAVRTLDRAVEINPNLAIAWGYSGLVRAYAGDSEVAIECCARAMRLSPLDPSRWIFLFGTGIAHLTERRLDDALVWLHRACEERPNFPALLAFLTSTLAHLGRSEEARAMLQHLLAEFPLRTVLLRRAPAFFKKAAVWQFILDGLRLAGLPET